MGSRTETQKPGYGGAGWGCPGQLSAGSSGGAGPTVHLLPNIWEGAVLGVGVWMRERPQCMKDGSRRIVPESPNTKTSLQCLTPSSCVLVSQPVTPVSGQSLSLGVEAGERGAQARGLGCSLRCWSLFQNIWAPPGAGSLGVKGGRRRGDTT